MGVIRPIVESLPTSYEKVSLESKLKRFVAAGDLDWQAAHASWRMIFSPSERRRLLAPIADRPGAAADAVDLYKACFSRTNARDPLNQMLYVDTMLYLPADMLVEIDRMTMAHGLEAREPYLDYRVVELCARMPVSLKLHRLRHKKHILKQVLRGRIPDPVLFRKKQGFNVPKAQWIRSGLRAKTATASSCTARRPAGCCARSPAASTSASRSRSSMGSCSPGRPCTTR